MDENYLKTFNTYIDYCIYTSNIQPKITEGITKCSICDKSMSIKGFVCSDMDCAFLFLEKLRETYRVDKSSKESKSFISREDENLELIEECNSHEEDCGVCGQLMCGCIDTCKCPKHDQDF